MKRLAFLLAFGVLGTSGAARPSQLLRSRTVSTPSGPVRLMIPRQFEPLRPGSIYPDRSRPVAPRGCPVAIVERGLLSRETREFFLERGFVVAVARRATIESAEDLFSAFAAESAADSARAVLLCRVTVPEALAPKLRAAVLLDPSLSRAGIAALKIPIALFLRAPGREPSDPLSARLRQTYGKDAIEKWYRSESAFPREALRDAAEWLAAETARPAGV